MSKRIRAVRPSRDQCRSELVNNVWYSCCLEDPADRQVRECELLSQRPLPAYVASSN